MTSFQIRDGSAKSLVLFKWFNKRKLNEWLTLINSLNFEYQKWYYTQLSCFSNWFNLSWFVVLYFSSLKSENYASMFCSYAGCCTLKIILYTSIVNWRLSIIDELDDLFHCHATFTPYSYALKPSIFEFIFPKKKWAKNWNRLFLFIGVHLHKSICGSARLALPVYQTVNQCRVF